MLLILVLMMVYKWTRMKPAFENMYISLDVPGAENPDAVVKDIYAILLERCISCDMRRVEVSNDALHLAVEARLSDIEALGTIADELKAKFSGANICFIDNTDVPKP